MKVVSCHTTNSKPVKQEVNGTVILPPLVFLVVSIEYYKSIQINESTFGSVHCEQICDLKNSSSAATPSGANVMKRFCYVIGGGTK
jgi:hypothetical protein